jgi:hypothetical protein
MPREEQPSPACSAGAPGKLLQVVYVSSAVEPWTEEALMEALKTFREKNARRGITGMLLHSDGNFIQAIEGPPGEILPLERKIAADPRHRGFITMIRRELAAREFDGWSMGFRNLSQRDLSAFPGWADVFGANRPGLDSPDRPGQALRLLRTFRDTARV